MPGFVLSGPALLPDGQIEAATISLDGDRIARVTPGADPGADLRVGGIIAPGLIDLQLNGGWGHDFSADGATVAAVAARLPATGVTAFLPTLITAPLASYPRRLAEIEAARPAPGGATVLGVHLEGPYLNPRRAGAHDPALLRPIDPDELARWADHPLVRLVTLAPELPGALDAVRRLRGRGLVVSAGHSDATFDEAAAAFAAGVAWGTHLFNAMRPLHHREPGLTGALLTEPISCGLIADGVHVHPAALRLAWRAKGAGGLTLVTDAMTALGLAPGAYRLGDRAVTVDAVSVRLPDGTLAGSILTLDQAVRTMVALAGCPPAAALTMATATPARLLGLATKGRLAAGADADLAVFDPALRVTHTVVGGRLVFAAPPSDGGGGRGAGTTAPRPASGRRPCP